MQRRTLLKHLCASGLALPVVGETASAPIRTAVIGHTGRGNFGHDLDAIWTHFPEVKVVALSDPDHKGRDAALAKNPGAEGFADYHSLLRETKPDMVVVAPRHVDQHHDMIMAAIGAGARLVYVEKPFCRTLAEADAIVAACASGQVRLTIAHRNRYHPALPVVRQLLRENKLGKLFEIRARGKEDHRGGPQDLWVLGSHVLNLVPVFTGPVTACSALFFQDDKPARPADLREGDEGTGPMVGNALHARYETESGIPVFFDSVKGTGTSEAGFGLQFIGEKGVIDLRMDQATLAHVRWGNPFLPDPAASSWQPVTSAGIAQPEPIVNLQQKWERHELAIRDLLAAHREHRAPLCSEKDGLAVTEMTMAAFASHVAQGARIQLPLADRGHPLAGWKG